jgi:hypothetical protein
VGQEQLLNSPISPGLVRVVSSLDLTRSVIQFSAEEQQNVSVAALHSLYVAVVAGFEPVARLAWGVSASNDSLHRSFVPLP